MLDEKKAITLTGKNNRQITLHLEFKNFKKLNKLTGNAFQTIDEFAQDSNKRLEHLPVIVQALSDEELTMDEIEKHILGFSYPKILQISNLICKLLEFELFSTEVKTESENDKDKKDIKKN
jgi:hypothetical protein